MARIELEFNDKKFTIEYDRASVREFLRVKENISDLDQAVALIKCGLLKHHKDDMPSEEDILGWVMAMEDLNEFAKALSEMVQDVLSAIKTDRKNLKWAKVEA